MKFKFPDSVKRMVFNSADYQSNVESSTNRRQRRNNGPMYAPAKSAQEWARLVSLIDSEEKLKEFQQIVLQQHPRHIPMAQLRAMGLTDNLDAQ